MANLQRQISDYILDLLQAEKIADKPLDESYYDQLAQQLKKRFLEAEVSGSLIQLTIQTLATYGIAKGLEIIRSVDFNTQDALNDVWNKTFVKDISVRNKMQYPKVSYEEFVSAFNTFYFNFLNKWHVSFSENKAIKKLSNYESIYQLLSLYSTEVTLPKISIETTPLTLDYTKNEDVSNIDYGEISVSFHIDKDMLLYKGIMSILNEMKNFKTGRYGYKENYKFDNIEVMIYNGWNEGIANFVFYNCVLKSVTDLKLNDESKSNIDIITCVFIYDYMEYTGV